MEHLCTRFAYAAHENVIGDFNKLCQGSTIGAYQERFESLKSLVLAKNKHLTEQYFVDSFLSGLKDEIKITVQMFGPKTLSHAFSLAKLQEAALENAKKNRLPTKFNNSLTNTSTSSTNTYKGGGK